MLCWQKRDYNKFRSALKEPLGVQMAEFPLPPMHSKCLLTSSEFGCSEEIVTIIAMMQIQDVFITPTRNRHEAVAFWTLIYLREPGIFINASEGRPSMHYLWIRPLRISTFCIPHSFLSFTLPSHHISLNVGIEYKRAEITNSKSSGWKFCLKIMQNKIYSSSLPECKLLPVFEGMKIHLLIFF